MTDLSGKTIVVTGGNSGIGKETARALGGMGAKVVLVCRNEKKGMEAQIELNKKFPGKFELLIADMSNLRSIETLATKLISTYPKIDVLLHNAGVFCETRQESADGIEMTMAVNHVGVFHLTHLLLDHMKKSTPARIIIVSSEAHMKAKVDLADLQFKSRSFRLLHAYGQSKLMNLLFMRELHQKLHGTGVTVNCVHPGVVATNIVSATSGPLLKVGWAIGSLFMLSPEKGARTSVKVASDPALENVSDKYFDKEAVSKYNILADDRELAKKVWMATEKLINEAKARV